MKTLEENLRQFEPEFTLVMEEAKDRQLLKVISFALKEYEVKNDVANLTDDEKKSLASFLRQIYEFGFYAGVNFALDPEEYMKDNDKEKK